MSGSILILLYGALAIWLIVGVLALFILTEVEHP